MFEHAAVIALFALFVFMAFMMWTVNRCRKSQEAMAADSKKATRQQERHLKLHRQWMQEHRDDFNHGEEWRKPDDDEEADSSC